MSTLKELLRFTPKLGVEFGSAAFEMTFFWQTIAWHIAKGDIKRGNGQPILILPGFTATDGSLIFLVWALRALGYTPYT